MNERWNRDYCVIAAIALVSCLLLAWSGQVVGLIAVGNGQGWDGSVFVRLIQEIAQDAYTNSDPYRAARTAAFPAIYFIEFCSLQVDLVLVQRDINIALMALSACMLYVSARLKDVPWDVAATTVATFLSAWCVLVVPVFTPILTDHVAIFTSSLSLLLWATDRKRGLYLIVALTIWTMPSSALVPLALLAIQNGHVGSKRIPDSLRFNTLLFMAVLALCAVVYFWKGHGILKGVNTHALDFRHNPAGQVTGSVALLPVSILVSVVMLFLCVRAAASFIIQHAGVFCIRHIVVGLAFALASFMLMRVMIDFDKGFTASKLVNNMTRQALSAPFKTWVAHTAYFGPVVLLVYYHVALRRTGLPPALLLCLIGFMPLLALGSESRQWVAVLPVMILALGFLPLSMLSRVVLLLVSGMTFWGIWNLNADVTKAVATHVGLQHPLWNNYLGRVGPWMSMDVYRHWIAFAALMVVAVLLADSPQRLRRWKSPSA